MNEKMLAMHFKMYFQYLLLFQLGDLGLGLGDLPVDLGDLLQEVVLGAPHVVPLRRPVVGGRTDRLHLRVVAGLLEQKNRFSFTDCLIERIRK